MSDLNTNSGFPEYPEPNKDDKSLQDTSSNPTESGTTYWESGQLQNTYELDDQPTQDSQTSNYNQQQTYDNNTNTYYETPIKKKSRKMPIVAAIAVILIIALAGTAFAFSGKLKNALAISTKSPKEYYAYAEKQSLGNSVDKITRYLNTAGSGQDTAAEISANLSYDKDTVNALLMSSTGMSLEHLEAAIGISLDSIGFDIVAALEDLEIYEKFSINLNKVDIISAEIFMNYATKETMIRLPDLSPAYLKQSLDMSEYGVEIFDFEGYKDLIKLLGSEKTEDFIKRYISIITNEIDDVKLTKGAELTVGDMSVEANLITLSINEEAIFNIAINMIREAKDDKYVLDLFSSLGVSKEDFIYELEKTENLLTESLEDMDSVSKLILMDVYVNKDGKIIGRNLRFQENGKDDATISYSYLEQNNKGSYEFSIRDFTGSNSIKLFGSHTIKDGAYTGLAELDITVQDAGLPQASFKIEYQDVKNVIKNNRQYSYGKYNLSSLLMMGMEISLEYDVKDGQQLTTLSLNMGRSPLITLDARVKYLDNFKIPKPSQNAESYDLVSQIDQYYYTLKIDEYLSNLSDKLGLNLESIFGNLLSFY